MSFPAAVRSEMRKLVSARSLLALPAFSVLYAFLSFGPVLTLSEAERRAQLDGDTLTAVARGPGFVVAVAMLLLGALMSSGEFRHKTITGTLLVRPRRRDVLASKALAVALVAAVTAVVVEAIVLALGVGVMRSHDLASLSSVADIAGSALAVVCVAVLYGMTGVGVGMALRDQTAAVGGVLLWIGIVEGAIPIILRMPWLFRYLPGGAANSLLGVADPPPDLLPAWGGALILMAVAGALSGAGASVFAARDVD